MNIQGFEKEFISHYSGWDNLDTMAIQFYDAKLKVDIGLYKAASIVENIAFDFQNCVGTVWQDDKSYNFSFKVILI